jgi:hypothetical protein
LRDGERPSASSISIAEIMAEAHRDREIVEANDFVRRSA